MKFNPLAFLAVLTLSLSSCGDDYNGPAAAPPSTPQPQRQLNPVTPQQIVGTWQGECETVTSEEGTQFESTEITLNADGSLSLTSTLFQNSGCSGPLIDAFGTGTYTLAAGGTSTTQQLTEISLSFRTPEGAQEANTQNICGINDWVAGVARDITGRDCLNGALIPQTTPISSVSQNRIEVFTCESGQPQCTSVFFNRASIAD